MFKSAFNYKPELLPFGESKFLKDKPKLKSTEIKGKLENGTIGKFYRMYCIVLYCIVLYCIVLYCIVLYCIVLYCIVLYCIVSYRIVLYIMYHNTI